MSVSTCTVDAGVIVRLTPTGEVAETVRIDNDPVALSLRIAKAGPDPEVVLEACYGWYWAVDLLQACGARVRLSHPLGIKGCPTGGLKTTSATRSTRPICRAWAACPRLGSPHPTSASRAELVRCSAKLVALRCGLKAQVHSVLAKEGVAVPMTDLFAKAGLELIAAAPLGPVHRPRATSLPELIEVYDGEVDRFTSVIRARLAADRGWRAIQAIPGVGPTLAAVLAAEIGDVTRFARPDKLCCWAGLTPRHRESDSVAHRSHITKQGSRLVRWAAVEAVQRLPFATLPREDRERVAVRRGEKIGKVAAARKLLTLVFYGLRDGRIRALPRLIAAQEIA